MGHSNLNLAALIGSRICHDLISPIGAINNGLELLDMAGGAQGPEMDLISDSVGNAGARIRFFRIAYGAASDQMLGRPEIVSILDDIGKSQRQKMRWGPLEPQPRSQVRMAFLAMQCCETAMPYGGVIHVMVEDGVWTLAAEADKMVIDDALWDGLETPGLLPHITPALVQFALLPEIAKELNRTVSAKRSNGQIIIRF
ncbi:histidine phosphotransferase family protein [Sedimentitalea sp. JM2-8]|uniref:Histidine phosphotransferase family protein n=1 Tax=Sedimentitalea xiamensis TaxID=3050037 RepID=A0ABT7FCA3_9RHOB|nr:histidine phosphotransferase family protein [Sedimentitalea xiamensis]MDK3072690.1 histidine phosphotransferase family protein [Sedimentitalea xiamensis]